MTIRASFDKLRTNGFFPDHGEPVRTIPLPMDETFIFKEVLEGVGVLSEYRPIDIFNVYHDAVSPGFMY